MNYVLKRTLHRCRASRCRDRVFDGSLLLSSLRWAYECEGQLCIKPFWFLERRQLLRSEWCSSARGRIGLENCKYVWNNNVNTSIIRMCAFDWNVFRKSSETVNRRFSNIRNVRLFVFDLESKSQNIWCSKNVDFINLKIRTQHSRCVAFIRVANAID